MVGGVKTVALRGAVGVKKGRVKTLPYGMEFLIYHSLVCRWGGVKKVLDFPTGGVSFSHPAAALAGIPLTGKAELPGFCRHKCRKGRFFCPGIECPADADLFGKIKRFMNRNGRCGGIGRQAAGCRHFLIRRCAPPSPEGKVWVAEDRGGCGGESGWSAGSRP